MKRIALVALALVLAPVLGAAQDAPPGGPPPGGPDAMGAPNPQRMAEMRQMHERLGQLRIQTRAQMLAALTPQHRAAVATLVGQAAIAANPDPRELAQRIDSLLSRGEGQNVMALAASERVNSRNMMEAARAQFESTLSPEEQAKMKQRDAQMAAREAQRAQRPSFTPDPGRELVHTLLGFGGGHEGMRGGPGGPMGGFHQ